jgi:hypothetical protein
MNFESFIANSKAIFERYPNEQVWLQGGFVPNRQLQQPEAGYCVVLRYDGETTHLISHFMSKVYAILPPAVEYNERSFHTTVGIFGKGELKGFEPDSAIPKSLGNSVETGLMNSPRDPKVTLDKWLFNNESLLISGYPNQDLWQLSQNIVNASQGNRVPLEPVTIIHITTARFIRAVPSGIFEQFLHLMQEAPLIGPTKPMAIDIATWRCDGMTFEIVIHERFPL